MKRVTQLFDRFALALEHLLAIGFMVLFAVTILNIVLRNVAGIAWMWIPGFSRLAFIWLVFLGIAAAMRRGEHLVIDLLERRLRGRAKRGQLVVLHAALLPFYWMLLTYGYDVAQVRMRIPFDTWRFPTGWAYMAVPVAAAILLAFTLERLVSLARERPNP